MNAVSKLTQLWVVPARKTPVAVIFRRGPRKLVQQILWHTKTNRFEPGQWFKGSVNMTLADLSPNGELLIYPAQKINFHTLADGNRGGVGEKWIAISRPPYFTALALWSHRSYLTGGGYFEKNHRVVLAQLKQTSRAFGLPLPRHLSLTFDHNASYDQAYVNAGWEQFDVGQKVDGWRWRQSEPTQQAILLRRNYLGYSMVSASDYALQYGGKHIALGVADWAGFIHDGRLALAREGRLLTCTLRDATAMQWETLADFSGARFEPVLAPPWAKKWPRIC